MSLEPDLQWHPAQGEQDILSHISCESFWEARGATTPGCALFCTRHGQQRWGHAGSEGFRGPCGGHGARHGQVRAWILHYHGLPAACQALCPLLSPRYNTWGFRFGLGGSKLVDFTSIQRDSGKSWPLKLFYFKDFIFTYLVSSPR